MVKEHHPDITPERRAEWLLMRNAADGEGAIKRGGLAYLPMPSGFRAQPDAGAAMYDAYRMRAGFPEILAPTLAGAVGTIHAKDIPVEMPSGMDYLRVACDPNGLTLEAFHRRITRALLLMGRYGVLADVPEMGDPWLVGYAAEKIINWDADWFVLDESGMVRDGFTWELQEQYLLLELDGGRYTATRLDEFGAAVADPVVPTQGGSGSALDFVPFYIGNARDAVPDVETPPLIGVAQAAVDIYQLDADYRHQLYMSGQETLVAINGEPPTAVGAGVVHQMNGTEGLPADLKYVSPECTGIDAHREAKTERQQDALRAGARLLDNSGNSQESGEARRMRFGAETATLKSVSDVSCELLQRGLRAVAVMKGLDPESVIVEAPSELGDTSMDPADAAALVGAWQGGAFSYDTLHWNLQRGGIIPPDRDADAEFALSDREQFEDGDAVQNSGDAAI